MNAIQKYFKYRQSLIDQYLKGDMTKREYLAKNYETVLNNDIGPFKNTDTVEKALYNYQYYNAMAKQYKYESTSDYIDWEIKKICSTKAITIIPEKTTQQGMCLKCWIIKV